MLQARQAACAVVRASRSNLASTRVGSRRHANHAYVGFSSRCGGQCHPHPYRNALRIDRLGPRFRYCYTQAYGMAQLTPPRAATPTMRYAVGSISKEFTATALLLLQESGKLSIDDPAGKWISGMGPAANASIRSLLSHTSGIRYFWPQDYDPPEMSRPIKPQEIVARWANQPLDFATGTAWQYSNTGYTVAGIIAERASHKPLFQFLEERIFQPLKMT